MADCGCLHNGNELSGICGLHANWLRRQVAAALAAADAARAAPTPMLLWCPECGHRHIDRGKYATRIHHTHACQICGAVWRPAIVATVGVQFLPGFKDPPSPGADGDPT